MNSPTKILISFACAVLFVTASYFVFQNYFVGKAEEGAIKIIGMKAAYGTNESIIVKGQAKINSNITLLWDDKMGSLKSDSKGSWAVNLGMMPEGNYSLQAISEDSSNSRSITSAQVSVVKPVAVASASLINNISEFLTASVSSGMKSAPKRLVMVSALTPPALSGKWQLIK